ncbi:MAG: cobalamin-dependent protein, partial [Planctomycetes bacterium]|nr:cobalamin-dependent protein [Planctomycetota bacterium]
MADIVLATFDAKWIHASFGLRCLRANLGELRDRSALFEFDLETRALDAAEAILAVSPRIVGLGVYVWNATLSLQLARLLKQLRPELVLVVGGPEVSYETEAQELARLADHVVRGEADLAFAELCRARLHSEVELPHLIDAPPPRIEQLAWPYDEYDARDLAHRVVYVEASRGCPFTCEFCLSALEIPVRAAPLEG